MSQLSFSSLGYAAKKKTTKREVFLAEMPTATRPTCAGGRSGRRRKPACWRSTTSRSAWTAKGLGDDVIVERLWRSVKHEEVHLHVYENASAAREGTGRYLDLYNRRHSALARAFAPHEYVPQGSRRLYTLLMCRSGRLSESIAAHLTPMPSFLAGQLRLVNGRVCNVDSN
jgi:hypothetical protein